MLLKCAVIILVATTVLARTTPTIQNHIEDQNHYYQQQQQEQHQEQQPRSDSTTYFGDLKYVYKVYQDCASKDLTSCLKLKLLAAMDRAARNFAELPIFDGITFVKDPKATTTTSSSVIKTEADIEANLPRALDERNSALNSLIADRVSNFFETYSLQIKLPTTNELARSFNGDEEEARGKKKKGHGYLILPLILGGTLIPLALGALALLAGKALIVSKLALVLASIIGLKKLLSGGHHHSAEAGHEVVVSGGHNSGWGRTYEKDAQSLAYSAYAPKSR